MSEEREFITKEKALEMIGEKEEVHVFRNPSGMLIGADWPMKEIRELLDNAKTIEIGGASCRSMGHPLVVQAKGERGFHFLEAKL